MSFPSSDPEQLLTDIIAKVRRIELKTRKQNSRELSGDYRSNFRGQGIDFHDYRTYQHGDDVRNLDWNVTARLGEPHIRTFSEERQQSVLLLVDISGSSNFGSQENNRREFACKAAAQIAFSALDNKDLVGLGLFSNQVEKWVAPKRGKQHGLRILRDILIHKAASNQSDLTPTLETLLSPAIPPSLVVIFSDFLFPDCSRTLRLASQRHEIICIHLTDPAEIDIPPLGKVIFEDLEKKTTLEVDTNSSHFRKTHSSRIRAWRQDLQQQVIRAGAAFLPLQLDQDPGKELHQFFQHYHHG